MKSIEAGKEYLFHGVPVMVNECTDYDHIRCTDSKTGRRFITDCANLKEFDGFHCPYGRTTE